MLPVLKKYGFSEEVLARRVVIQLIGDIDLSKPGSSIIQVDEAIKKPVSNLLIDRGIDVKELPTKRLMLIW